jgi:hypothetical protein
MTTDRATELGETIVRAAEQAHRQLRPQVDEPAFQDALAAELRRQGLRVRTDVTYRPPHSADSAYKMNLVVESAVAVRIEPWDPEHELKLKGRLNFYAYLAGMAHTVHLGLDGAELVVYQQPVTRLPSARYP